MRRPFFSLCMLLLAFSLSVPIFGQTLEIHVIATREDMVQGRFRVEFLERLTVETTRDLYFGSRYAESQYAEGGIVPYVTGSDVKPEWVNWGFRFQLSQGDSVTYGYVVYPSKEVAGSGICNEDIAILDLPWNFPKDLEMHDGWWGYRNVDVVFDTPPDLPVYTPWPKASSESNHRYRIISDRIMHHAGFWSGIVAWGNFTSADMLDWGADHRLVMLGYKTDTDNTFNVIRSTYRHLLHAYTDYPEFLPVQTVIAILPEDSPFKPLSEGMGGYFIPNWGGQATSPVFQYDNPQWYAYLPTEQALEPLSITGIHPVVHTLISMPDWSFVEGVAVFYQHDMLRRMNLLTDQQMRREWAGTASYYLSHFVGEGKDQPLFEAGLEGPIDEDLRFIVYLKSALVFFVMDELINIATNGERRLVDLLRVYNRFLKAEYSSLWQNKPLDRKKGYDLLIRGLTYLTATDATAFFSRYVFSSEPLPIQVEGTDLNVSFEMPARVGSELPLELLVVSDTSSVTVALPNGLPLSIKFQDGEIDSGTLKIVSPTTSDFETLPLRSAFAHIQLGLDQGYWQAELTMDFADSMLISEFEDSLTFCVFDSLDKRGFIWHALPSRFDQQNRTVTGAVHRQGGKEFLFAVASERDPIMGIIPGDFDQNGEVSFSDFLPFAAAYGGKSEKYDLDANGEVSFSDFLIFTGNYGRGTQ